MHARISLHLSSEFCLSVYRGVLASCCPPVVCEFPVQWLVLGQAVVLPLSYLLHLMYGDGLPPQISYVHVYPPSRSTDCSCLISLSLQAKIREPLRWHSHGGVQIRPAKGEQRCCFIVLSQVHIRVLCLTFTHISRLGKTEAVRGFCFLGLTSCLESWELRVLPSYF